MTPAVAAEPCVVHGRPVGRRGWRWTRRQHTGEHGLGLRTKDVLIEAHSADGVELMARIKRAFNPLNILNPGKVRRV